VAVIFRGPESFQYPSRKEFQHLAEIMHQVRGVQRREQLSDLAKSISSLVPHQYAANGTFDLSKRIFRIGHSNYGDEHTHLYETQGYRWDPAIHLLEKTHIGTVSSEDLLDLETPKEVVNLKLDAGINECLTVGVRGVLGACTYFAFSNFDKRLLNKFRTLMQILGPHFHLAYMRATSWADPSKHCSKSLALTEREEEIMRWVAEGKTNWEISVILKVSLNTVKFHLKNVYQKLGGVENRWSAVAQWQSGNLVRSDFLEIEQPPQSSDQQRGKPSRES
jgi:DNA-binding CsgD family transcriptional regulator